MNVKPENYVFVVISKMNSWLELAFWGLNPWDRVKGRKNYRELIRRHADIAEQYGFSEENLDE